MEYFIYSASRTHFSIYEPEAHAYRQVTAAPGENVRVVHTSVEYLLQNCIKILIINNIFI